MQVLAYFYHWTPQVLYDMSIRERRMWVELLKEWKQAEAEQYKT